MVSLKRILYEGNTIEESSRGSRWEWCLVKKLSCCITWTEKCRKEGGSGEWHMKGRKNPVSDFPSTFLCNMIWCICDSHPPFSSQWFTIKQTLNIMMLKKKLTSGVCGTTRREDGIHDKSWDWSLVERPQQREVIDRYRDSVSWTRLHFFLMFIIVASICSVSVKSLWIGELLLAYRTIIFCPATPPFTLPHVAILSCISISTHLRF